MNRIVRSILYYVLATVLVAPAVQAQVKTGLENLLENHLDLIQGKRVGIIANHTAVDAKGRSIVDLISRHTKITAVFGPEHGFEGNVEDGASIEDTVLKGVPIYSLYGEFRTPTPAMLKDVDVLIYDIQDVGVKFYTFISNLFLAMQAAKRDGIPFLVLDRPDPIDGTRVEGPVTNPASASFVGVIPLAIRYGMTVGEIAKLFNGETYAGFAIGCDLTVVEMTGYQRDMWYDETGLPWVMPSPNMTTLDTATIYPGTCLIEGTTIAEGRGTDAPFLKFGAPYIDAKKWLDAMPQEVLKGIKIETIDFVPKDIPGTVSNPKYKGKTCHGFHVTITDRDVFQPIPFTVALLCAARQLYPKEFTTRRHLELLWGNEDLRAMLKEGSTYQEVMKTTQLGNQRFKEVREKYLIY